MAANGRGTMRPTGRSPPFLAIGLFVALIILGFNYWTLSARNGEQANEITMMESELRLVNSKKVSAEKRSEAVTDKVKDLEDELNKHKQAMAIKAAELQDVNNEITSLKSSFGELEATVNDYRNDKLPKCEEAKTKLESELAAKGDELEKEKQLLNEKQCGETECASFIATAIAQSREKALQDVVSAAGAQPLIYMVQKSMDVGSYRNSVEDLIAKQGQQGVQQQQQQQQPLNQQQQQVQQPQQQQQQQNNPDTQQSALNQNPGANQNETGSLNQIKAPINQAPGETDEHKEETAVLDERKDDTGNELPKGDENDIEEDDNKGDEDPASHVTTQNTNATTVPTTDSPSKTMNSTHRSGNTNTSITHPRASHDNITEGPVFPPPGLSDNPDDDVDPDEDDYEDEEDKDFRNLNEEDDNNVLAGNIGRDADQDPDYKYEEDDEDEEEDYDYEENERQIERNDRRIEEMEIGQNK